MFVIRLALGKLTIAIMRKNSGKGRAAERAETKTDIQRKSWLRCSAQPVLIDWLKTCRKWIVLQEDIIPAQRNITPVVAGPEAAAIAPTFINAMHNRNHCRHSSIRTII